MKDIFQIVQLCTKSLINTVDYDIEIQKDSLNRITWTGGVSLAILGYFVANESKFRSNNLFSIKGLYVVIFIGILLILSILLNIINVSMINRLLADFRIKKTYYLKQEIECLKDYESLSKKSVSEILSGLSNLGYLSLQETLDQIISKEKSIEHRIKKDSKRLNLFQSIQITLILASVILIFLVSIGC